MKRGILMVTSLLILCSCGGNVSDKGSNGDDTINPNINNNDDNDYGTVEIARQSIREGYSKEITPTFSKPEKAEKLEYTVVDESVVSISEEGIMTGLKEGTTQVVATSEHFEDIYFYISVVSDSQFAAKVESRQSEYIAKDYPLENRTIFAGDSFFDTQFWSNFYSDYYGEYNTHTVGISATTADDWYYYIERIVIPFSPKNLVFHIGTNDINDDGCSYDVAYNRIEKLLNKVHENLPETTIYILSVEPSTTFASNFEKEKKCNELTKKYCETNSSFAKYIDTFSEFLNESGTGAVGSMFRDGLHPTLANYTIIDKLLKEAGLTMSELPSSSINKSEWQTLNASDNNASFMSYENNTLIIDGSKTATLCTTNRAVFTNGTSSTYYGDVLISGKMKYSDVTTSNYFSEMYAGVDTSRWSDSNCLQVLMWNNVAQVYGHTGVAGNISPNTEYDFALIGKGSKIYMKFNNTWWSKDIGGTPCYSFSAENLKLTVSELNTSTKEEDINSAIPESVNYSY